MATITLNIKKITNDYINDDDRRHKNALKKLEKIKKGSDLWKKWLKTLGDEYAKIEDEIRDSDEKLKESQRKKLARIGFIISHYFSDPKKLDKWYAKPWWQDIHRCFFSAWGQNIKNLLFFLTQFLQNKNEANKDKKKITKWEEHQAIYCTDKVNLLLGPAPTEKQVATYAEKGNFLRVSFAPPWELKNSKGKNVTANIWSKDCLATRTTSGIENYGADNISDPKEFEEKGKVSVFFPFFDHTLYDVTTGDIVTAEKSLKFIKEIAKIFKSTIFANILFHCWSGIERSVVMTILTVFFLNDGKKSLTEVADEICKKRFFARHITKFSPDVLLIIAEVYLKMLQDKQDKELTSLQNNYEKLSLEKRNEDLKVLCEGLGEVPLKKLFSSNQISQPLEQLTLNRIIEARKTLLDQKKNYSKPIISETKVELSPVYTAHKNGSINQPSSNTPNSPTTSLKNKFPALLTNSTLAGYIGLLFADLNKPSENSESVKQMPSHFLF